MGYEFSIALRHLRAHKSRGLSLVGWLSLIGVAVGVAALIGGFSVTSGFNKAFAERLLGVTAHISIRKPMNFEDVMRRVDALPGVVGTSAATHEQAMLTGPDGSVGTVIKGVDVVRAKRVLNLAKHIVSGRLEDLKAHTGGTEPGIVLGVQLAHSVGAKVGDVVTLLSPTNRAKKETWGAVNGTPNMRALRVVALYRSGYFEFDRRYAYIDLSEAQRFFGLGSRVEMIEIRVDDPEKASTIAQSIRGQLELPYRQVLDWRTSYSNLFASLTMQRIAILIVLGVMVILAACNVASMLIMMVIERTRDIAILKAMGSHNSSIRKIFIYEGLLIGVVGVATGMVIAFLLFEVLLSTGIRLDPMVYGIDRLPLVFRFDDYLFAGVGAMVITLIASAVPAIRAARLRPADGLRELL